MRNNILKMFAKYCKFSIKSCCCCAEFTVFDGEINKFPHNIITNDMVLNINYEGKNIKRIKIKNYCCFLNSEGCSLELNVRPLDCVSYPIYPDMQYSKYDKFINGAIVHKSCPQSELISQDFDLISAVLSYWSVVLPEISKKDLKDWFGNKKNYWLDCNIIKVII